MSIFETIDLQELNKVTELSRTEKSCVWLVSTEAGKEFAVWKEYQNRALLPLYERLQSIQSEYFPQIYRLTSREDSIVLLEEYLPGETLQAKIESEKKLSEEELTGYICSMGKALQVLHNAIPPIVYRDLKPQNIIITPENRLKIVDFDAVREYKEEQSRDTVVLGTKEYASPEQYGFMQTDIRTDVYSLGIVYAELLEKADASSSYRKAAKEIIKKATMFAPDDRYPNMEDLLRDVNKIGRKPGWKPIVAGLCICALLAAAVMWLRPRDAQKEPAKQVTNELANPPTGELVDSADSTTEATTKPAEDGEVEPTPTTEPQPEPTAVPLYASVYEDYCAKLPDIEQNHSWIYSGVGVLEGEIVYDGFYADYQESIAGNGFLTLRFFKDYPREVMFDHVCVEGLEPEQVWYSKFDENAMADGEWIQLEAEHYYESYPNVWALSPDWLQTLEPGTYTFWFYYGRELFGFYLVVHGEGEELGNYFIRGCCELAFYSSEVQNDVFKYFQNMPHPIASVSINDRELKEDEYELAKDGYAVILHPEILQEFEHLIAADLFVTTEDGHQGSSRIVFLNTMKPKVTE